MKPLKLSKTAVRDLGWWAKNNKRTASRILELLVDISRNPSQGKGKPEPLKHNLSGYWSRRIDQKHRIIYKPLADSIEVISCKGHYD